MNYYIISNTFDNIDTMWFEQPVFSGQSLFILPQWLQIWWKVFKPTAKLFLISIYQDEAPLGLAPLMVKDNIATFIGDPEIIDYQDCIVVSGREREFFGTLLDCLNEQKISQLDLRMLRPNSCVLTYLTEIARSRNYFVSIEPDSICSEIELPDSWDKYLALLKPKQRKEVKRKIRRLQEVGKVHFRVIEQIKFVKDILEPFFVLFRNSRQDKARFMTEQMKDYFRELILAMAKMGALRIGILELNGQIVAVSLTFYYAGRVYLYNNAYAPEYSQLSVGLIAKIFSIKDALEQGYQIFDFLRGDETYKFHLGSHVVNLSRCQIRLVNT